MTIDSILTPWRLKWYSIAILVSLGMGLCITLLSGKGPKIISGRLGGDFTAFYAAGRSIITRHGVELYDLDEQIERQKDLYPESEGVLPFAYPPLVALACAPLALFSYRVAFVIWFFSNITAFLLAFFCLRKIIPELRSYFLPAFAICLTFYPFLKAIFNGQNTAFTFMLIALVWLFTLENRFWLAGFFLGLLFYKLQFAVPLIGLFFLSGRMKVVITALVTGIIVFSASLLVVGFQGYENWYQLLKWFSNADAVQNKHNAVSWIGFLDAIFGIDNKTSTIIGTVLCLASIMGISSIWAFGKKKADFSAQMALAAVTLVLIQPHVMYYDAGLIAITYAVILQRIKTRNYLLIFSVWLLSFAQIFAKPIGFSPIFFIVAFTYFFSHYRLLSSATKHGFKHMEQFVGP